MNTNNSDTALSIDKSDLSNQESINNIYRFNNR